MIRIFILALFFLCSIESNGQRETIKLSLPEVITLAQSDAPDALLAKTRLSNRHWFYQSILADYKPQIDFNGIFPEINRFNQRIITPTGEAVFVNRSDMLNSIGLSLSQNIVKTGGSIFATTELQRLDVFAGPSGDTKDYFSTPIAIGFFQPIFAFNRFKWEKKIEPLRYQEATKQYAEQMEDVAYDASVLFFDLLIEQLNVQAAQIDKNNADTLFNISKGRFEVGRIAETELLQIELSANNADANLAQASLNLQQKNEELRNFLGITNLVLFELSSPQEIPSFGIDVDKALEYALRNRSEIIGFERRIIQANSEVAEAKADSGPTVNIQGSIGISRTSRDLADAYQTPFDDNERVSLTLQVPIADWGKAKARLKVATSNLELEQMNVEQERISFEREITLKVQQFDLIRNQVTLAKRAYDVAIKRADITRQRYYIGKIGITDLNIAIAEKENARSGYIQALRSFWLASYDIRRLTLYDFERNVSLVKTITDF